MLRFVLFVFLIAAVADKANGEIQTSFMLTGHDVSEPPALTPSSPSPEMETSTSPQKSSTQSQWDNIDNNNKNWGGEVSSSSSLDEPEPAAASVEAPKQKLEIAESPSAIRRMGRHRYHKNIDECIIGGGIIVGGLVASFVISVACYIRATRRRTEEPNKSQHFGTS
uniref:Uncharacterized protein n=1 Tax=Nelumbo nucifera TaxID=4432 RepID=A0A822YAG7_NELNU|nr:TPA_asm: hypothetical protein HUJ06_028036 [Nelumbo nucifera]